MFTLGDAAWHARDQSPSVALPWWCLTVLLGCATVGAVPRLEVGYTLAVQNGMIKDAPLAWVAATVCRAEIGANTAERYK